jgi:hypothetical protein
MMFAAVALVPALIIVGSSYSGKNILDFLLTAETKSTLSIGTAEAAILPLDVKDNFRVVEREGDARDKPALIKIDAEFVDPDENCEFCYRIEIQPGATGNLGAMLKANKLFNLEKAERVYFFARGENGGEDVQFDAAGKFVDGRVGGKVAKLMKFGFTSESTELKTDWQRYEIDLSGADLSSISHGFGFEVVKSKLKASEKPIVIYLKGITFDDQPAEKAMRSSTNSTSS